MKLAILGIEWLLRAEPEAGVASSRTQVATRRAFAHSLQYRKLDGIEGTLVGLIIMKLPPHKRSPGSQDRKWNREKDALLWIWQI